MIVCRGKVGGWVVCYGRDVGIGWFGGVSKFLGLDRMKKRKEF